MNVENLGDMIVVRIGEHEVGDRRLDDELEATLQSNASSRLPVLVDLGAVKFINSSAIGYIMRWVKGCNGANMRVALGSVDPQVQKIIGVTGMGDLVAIHADYDSARTFLLT